MIQFERVSKKFNLHQERARSFKDLLVSLPRQRNGSARTQGEFWALSDVSFDVTQGQTVGFIGPNGAGKSTVLKLISQIIEPTMGRVGVHGKIGALLELGAGFHPDLTGRENIYLNGSILGLSRHDIRGRFDDIVGFAELERFIDVPVKHYSSGMYVRLGFSVAVHTEPEILLIDEVLAVGDQAFQHKCLDRILTMKRQGTTICFVSHDVGTVRRLCTAAVWLEGGRARACGDVDDTINAYLRHSAQEEQRRSALDDDGHTPDILDGHDGCEVRRRWGSGAIDIFDVAILDEHGRRREVFQIGEPWRVRIRYRAEQRISEPIFGLAIHRNDGFHVCGPNTDFGNLRIPFVEGEGEIAYCVDRLPLMEGTYLVSISSHDRADTEMYDYHDRMYTFRVRQVGRGERYGLVTLGGEWQWKDH
ncbi:MAG: ABC transporter ATP-binding protein [Chloroflexi bacterium]|nr:ABC transporter ATP-binding protein [Chloroflexota bacterium]